MNYKTISEIFTSSEIIWSIIFAVIFAILFEVITRIRQKTVKNAPGSLDIKVKQSGPNINVNFKGNVSSEDIEKEIRNKLAEQDIGPQQDASADAKKKRR